MPARDPNRRKTVPLPSPARSASPSMVSLSAPSVVFVVGAQKLVPTLEAARERIYQHSLVLEDARAVAAYGQHSYVGKIMEIHQELPGRIHIVLVREPAGF